MSTLKEIENAFAEYGLKVFESDAKDRDLIDFDVLDGQDAIAWVWGNDPNDLEVECDHPYQAIEFGDDDERGECKICGATCDWHWENNFEERTREPHEWYADNKGLIKAYADAELEQMRGE